MALTVDEGTQLKRVEEDLLRRFDRLPRHEVCSEIEAGLRRFEGARIRTFVPVLLQKQVRDRLRRRI